MSLSECLTRMRDAVYVATGGRCHTAAGAAGGTTIACPDLELMNCLESGGSIAECLRANEGYGGGDDIGPNEGDWLSDRLGRSRGVAGAYIDSTPMGAVFITLCNEGVEQLCRGLGRF